MAVQKSRVDMEYFAFGEVFVQEHKNSHNSPYKFNGKELDEESGNYYYGARYYDPRVSLWLSVDGEFENGPGVSPYVYCFNNPINLTDPDGNWPFPSWSTIKSRAKNMVRDVAYAVVAKTISATRNYVAQKVNAVKKSISNTASKVSKAISSMEITQKDGYDLYSSGESKQGIGGDSGFFKEAKGAKSSGSLDVEVLMVGAEVMNPDFENKIMEGAKLGADLYSTFGNTGSTNPATASAPTTSDDGMITMPLEDYSATPVLQWNSSQLHKQERDTAVAPSQKGVIDRINKGNRMEAEKKRDANNRELQKRIDYYKQ